MRIRVEKNWDKKCIASIHSLTCIHKRTHTHTHTHSHTHTHTHTHTLTHTHTQTQTHTHTHTLTHTHVLLWQPEQVAVEMPPSHLISYKIPKCQGEVCATHTHQHTAHTH